MARSLGDKRPNLALKAKIEYDDEEEEEEDSEWCPEKTKLDYNDHMAVAAKAFWSNKGKVSKSRDNTRGKPSGPRANGPRLRTCFNCGDENHFIAECPFENREDNGGRLIRKDVSKPPPNKNADNKNFPNKRAPPRGLVALEQYDTGDEEEESEEAVAAIATTTSPMSLFDAPNENLSTNNPKCLMARATEVTSTSNITPNSNVSLLGDKDSLKVKLEVVSLDAYLSNF